MNSKEPCAKCVDRPSDGSACSVCSLGLEGILTDVVGSEVPKPKRRTPKPLVRQVKKEMCECLGYSENGKMRPDYRACARKEFRQAYIEGVHEDCRNYPPTWDNENGGLDSIKAKFRYVFSAVIAEAVKRLGIPSHHLVSIIEPSSEDTTWAAILYNPWNHDRSTLAWFENTKAWHLKWESEDAMERSLQDMVEKVVAKVEEFIAMLPPEAVGK